MADALSGFDPKATYDAASRDYEDASRDFWQFSSIRTIERLGLKSGERVLDAACGTGPSVIAAAEAVGPTGHVVGIDYAGQMLDIARGKARSRRLGNVELAVGDMTALPYPPGSFDAVVSVLGLFFVDDMPALARSLWSLVRPQGGRLAVTVLGKKFFAPMIDVFVEAVAAEQPHLEVVQPWRRTEDVAVLRDVLTEGGVPGVVIESENEPLPLGAPSDWWRIALGTGLRRTVAQLDDAAARRVREACERSIIELGLEHVVLSVHYAVATKP